MISQQTSMNKLAVTDQREASQLRDGLCDVAGVPRSQSCTIEDLHLKERWQSVEVHDYPERGADRLEKALSSLGLSDKVSYPLVAFLPATEQAVFEAQAPFKLNNRAEVAVFMKEKGLDDVIFMDSSRSWIALYHHSEIVFAKPHA